MVRESKESIFSTHLDDDDDDDDGGGYKVIYTMIFSIKKMKGLFLYRVTVLYRIKK